MNVSIRKFKKSDIPNKVKWINDPENNTYLHYDIPLQIDKTEVWFENNKCRTDRYDAVIEVDGLPVGLIGLLSIDKKNKKAEYYVLLGESSYRGKGVAKVASKLLLEYAFLKEGLNRVYLYTEIENISAIRLYECIGFKKEGLLKKDLFSKGRFVDRFLYSICKSDFFCSYVTPIQKISNINSNVLYIKREDFIPFSFGGNKARKAQLFFEEIDRGEYDCVVTYGSSSSNHCRIVANMASARNMQCYIISPDETSKETYNYDMMTLFCAKICKCPLMFVSESIDQKINELKKAGRKPYFIPGGGHGEVGTQAYVECYEEIRDFELKNHIHFDYIFHASGTGTTQAGLVCGQLINRDSRKIVGISIARKNPRGRNVVLESIKEYINNHNIIISDTIISDATIFLDEYIGDGYGLATLNVDNTIRSMMEKYGIPLDSTYTGKAFAGMIDYINKNAVLGANILFIHTGGTPLYFDDIERVFR